MPSRLVYAPKAYVYTKSQDGTLNNLSPYVTAGNVQRKINQVSSATVTLRNPLKMFTGGQGQPRIFHPMDPITIYLERAKGYPVRVFTGYLDNTPYYQMYPGTCTLQASCTLKRLLYTFFDPSLPYVIAFFEKYGWYNSGSGSIISAATFNAGDVSTQAAVMSGKQPFTDLKDGSLARLLWATLYDIGQWKDTAIYIENLPTGANGIAARMAKLMQSTYADQQQAANDFTQFLHLVIGANSQGSGGGSGSTNSGTGGGSVTSTLLNANQRAFGSALSTATGLDPNVVAAWLISEEPASASQAPNGANNWLNIGATDAGFYGAGNPAWSDPTKAGQFTADWMKGKAAPGFGSASPGIQNILKSSNQSPQAQIHAIQQSGWASSGYPNLPQTYQTILNHNKGHSPVPTTSTQIANTSSQPAASNVKVVFPFPANSGYVSQSRWSQDQGVDISAPGNTPELAMADGTVIKHGIGGFGNWAPVLKLDQPIMGYNNIYYGHAGPNGLVAVGTHVTAGQQITSVYNGIAGISTGPHIEIGFCDQNGTPTPGSSGAMMQTLKSAQVGQTVPGGGTNNGGGSGTAGSDPSGGQAFVAELNFPSIEDSVTAVALGAEHKGLMHDQSLLPFVQQIAQASLRSFQSLPNGSFYGFYPDYFGEMGHHKPYWLIHDIEILSGGINLTDDSLATHVFAVGDNTMIDVFGGNSGSNELVNMLFSSGCINIFNAFVTTGTLDTSKIDKTVPKTTGLTPGIMKATEAVDFIKRYGARPLVQSYPMVRSSIFEMLLAYQQFMFAWSNQFKTPFTFTFMPELYPGGKVGFPEHGLQMYINSVTHDWNYEEGGFTTTADLTAPSILDGANPNDFPELPPNMVRALVEPVGAK